VEVGPAAADSPELDEAVASLPGINVVDTGIAVDDLCAAGFTVDDRLTLLADLLQFLVQELVAAAPIDPRMGGGNEQSQKRLELLVEGLFPRAVIA